MTASFARMATVTASTKRNPAAVAGKIGVPVAKLASLKILPVMPADARVLERYRIQSPRATFVTYAEGTPDVLKGDVLTATVDYRVVDVGLWGGTLEILLEKVVGT